MDKRRRFRFAELSKFGTSFFEDGAASATEIASATSATASSSFAGSNMILFPTAMTNNVTGGLETVAPLSCG